MLDGLIGVGVGGRGTGCVVLDISGLLMNVSTLIQLSIRMGVQLGAHASHR